MGVRKLGCLPPSTADFEDHAHIHGGAGSETLGYRPIRQYGRKQVQFANPIENRNYLEQQFLQRLRDHAGDHFEEAEFPQNDTPIKSSYTYANSVRRHGDKLPQVKVEDFLSACEFEVDRQKRRKCQKTQFITLCPGECDPEEDCVPCQVAQLKRDLKRRHSNGRWPDCKLCYRYRSQRATMKDIDEAQERATIPVCKKADIKDKIGLPKTPPPPPVSVMAILASPGVTPSPVQVGTPDSEYDTGKREQLIKKYIPNRKLTHYECQTRGRVFFYTDDTVSQGFVHQPYLFRKRHAGPVSVKKKTKSDACSTYAVDHLGLVITLPEPNKALVARQPAPPLRQWNNSTQLPPINVQRMVHVCDDEPMNDEEDDERSGCKTTTCSCGSL